VNYTHVEADGFSSAYDSTGQGDFDDDGYDQHAVTGRFDLKFGKRIRSDFFGTYSNYKTGLDAAAFRDDRDFTGTNTNKQAGGGLTYSFARGRVKANYVFNHSQRKYVNEPLHAPDPASAYQFSNYVGRMHFAEAYFNYISEKFEVLAGTDFRSWNTDQTFFSDGSWGPYSSTLRGKMKQTSPFASVIYKQGNGFNAELGSRVNLHSEYGTNVTFTFNPYYIMENRNKFFANVYTSYKAPTLYQLFDAFAGNPELDPEKGFTVEAGADWRSVPAFNARLVGFYRSGRDVILYTFDPGTFASKYLNASEQKNYGAELELGYRKEKKDFSLNYTYTDGKTTAPFDGTGSPLGKDTTYFNLYRIPKHALNLSLGYHFTRKIFTSLNMRAVGRREEYVYAGAPEELKGYVTADLYGEFRMNENARVYLDLRNITNKQYFEFLGYNARRFNVTAGINFQF
jgi:vitamin B12 transporter